MVVAVALVLLTLGSVLFHILSPWYLTPIASNWGTIDTTIDITFWVTGIVFVAVNLFMAYCVVKYQHREGLKAAYEPESKKLEAWLVGLTTVGVIAMLAPGLIVYAKVVNVPADAAVFEVVGQQWNWQYRFPGRDNVMGTVDARFVSDKNPFGLNPDDPNGQDDVLVSSPEVHLPVGKPVRANLRSMDVLHNFTVPQFRVKMDLVPGMVTYMWFTPTLVGKYDVLCEELCGIAHFTMRGRVFVDEGKDYLAWLGTNPTFAQAMAKKGGDAVAGKANFAVCASCHGLLGEGNPSMKAPKLSGQHDWYLKRQLKSFLVGARGMDKRDLGGMNMAPMAATLVNDAGIENVTAYIKTLPDTPAVPTLKTTSGGAKQMFDNNCAACHGSRGEGIKAMNAPRLSEMSHDYMVTQLENFRLGVRGSHPKDLYGSQMVLMAATLADDQAVKDLVAYIGSLRGVEKK